ncbi:MAG: HYR domain-containing protein [Verrucomicrobia bacterium]|nr:HYR domain-containing protein [Verrucomicrobiota bacterium]MBI3871340.1 HYR domain-containing protein [Verrucomicrobiota bacterium]
MANDNDFKAPWVYHNGVVVGTNTEVVDNLFLAYRVTLPAVGAPTPPNQAPGVLITGPTNATLSAPALVELTASAYDQDGKVMRVEFYEGGVKIGEDTTFPFSLSLPLVTAGAHDYSVTVTDNEGATSTAARTVIVTPDNLAPLIKLSGPTNSTLSGPAQVALTATANDPDGFVKLVTFYDGDAKVGEKSSPPYATTLSNVVAGLHAYSAVATDNQGATQRATFSLMVTPDNQPPTTALATPTNNAVFIQPANIAFTATASDSDGFVSRVEYYRGDTKLGQALAPPYSFIASNFPAGDFPVRAIAYDNQGTPTASTDALISVRDKTAPIIRCPTNVFAECAASEGAPVTFTVTATDNNDAGVEVVCVPPSGSLFPRGATSVNCVARDAAGNAASCSFTVTVGPSLLTIEKAVILRWKCGEKLQSADKIAGPWQDLEGAASPYIVPSAEARRFYRVVN